MQIVYIVYTPIAWEPLPSYLGRKIVYGDGKIVYDLPGEDVGGCLEGQQNHWDQQGSEHPLLPFSGLL